MLRIRYLYAEPLPAMPTPARPRQPSAAESISRHLERVGRDTADFVLRRELLATSTRLAESCCRSGGVMG